MKDYQVSKHNIDQYFEELLKELDEHKLLICSSQPANTGKWGMARLFRKWMATTADFMANNGVTMPLMTKSDGTTYGTRRFNADDAHELFTAQWLGVDQEGVRLSWSKTGRDGMRPATKGERFDALRKHENWCVEKGITLFVPRDSEYMQLIKEQNGASN